MVAVHVAVCLLFYLLSRGHSVVSAGVIRQPLILMLMLEVPPQGCRETFPALAYRRTPLQHALLFGGAFSMLRRVSLAWQPRVG